MSERHASTPARVGLDFDNTIVCYDGIFHRVAVEWGEIPSQTPPSKEHIRDLLRSRGREERWTEIQGYVYGPGMEEAKPFPGVIDFVSRCRRSGAEVSIISHRTRLPYRGPRYDLHEAARAWLGSMGLIDSDLGVAPGDVYFELTKAAKLQRIAACRCTHFVDDLPEFLAEPAFPAQTRRILFDSHNLARPALEEGGIQCARSWEEVGDLLLGLPVR